MNDITIRFLMFYDSLKKDGTLNSQKEYASRIGVSSSSLTEIFKKRTNVGMKIIQKTVLSFSEINAEWLITGNGEMLKEGEIKPTLGKTVPLVSRTAIAGFGNNNFSIEQTDIKELYNIPKFKHKNIDFMIEIEGDSMNPSFKSGDIVACTIINQESFIQWNKAHIVATNEQGTLLKRIKPGEDNNKLLLVSDNSDYNPIDIHKNEITGIALVAGVIRLE